MGPIGDFVLIRPFDVPEESAGILTPQTQTEKPSSGIVVEVGPGRVLENGTRLRPEVQPGEIVHFSDFAGKDVRLKREGDEEAKRYLVARQDELFYNEGLPYRDVGIERKDVV